MIFGIGLDVIELQRIEEAVARNARFVERVLTAEEETVYSTLGPRRKIEFLVGRYAAKEAFAKAYGTGIGSAVSFQSLTVLPNELGQPCFVRHPFAGTVHVSITHDRSRALAQVILEQLVEGSSLYGGGSSSHNLCAD